MDISSMIPSLEGIDDTEAPSDPQKVVTSRIIKYLIDKDLFHVPVTCVEIDWDEIATDELNVAQCKAIWKIMLKKSRFYRSAGEVMTTWLMNPHKKLDAETQKWNKQFLGVPNDSFHNKDHDTQTDTVGKGKRGQLRALKLERQKKFGPKPLSGYQIFTQEKRKEGLKMKEASTLWKSMDPETAEEFKQKAKEMFDDYVDNLENYIMCNPDDEDAKTVLNLFHKQAKSKKVNGSEDSSDLLSSPTKKEKKRKENGDEELSSSPRKKKKKDKSTTEWTGFSVYKSKKKEELASENPQMSDSEVNDKLEKKYKKLSTSKKEKYETIAKEMNEEGRG